MFRRKRSIDDFEFEIRRLRLNPGDGLIFTTPKMLTQEAAKNIRTQLLQYAEKLGINGIPTLVIDGGSSVDVISAHVLAGKPPPAKDS